MHDMDGENRAAAAAAAVARKKWREAQAIAANASGPLVWVNTQDRLPEPRSFVLVCFEQSLGYHPGMQILVFIKPSLLDLKLLSNLDGALDEQRAFTANDFKSVDGAFWDTDGHLFVPTDDDFPSYWMPLPPTPWECGGPK